VLLGLKFKQKTIYFLRRASQSPSRATERRHQSGMVVHSERELRSEDQAITNNRQKSFKEKQALLEKNHH